MFAMTVTNLVFAEWEETYEPMSIQGEWQVWDEFCKGWTNPDVGNVPAGEADHDL